MRHPLAILTCAIFFLVTQCFAAEQTQTQTTTNAQCLEAMEVSKDMTPPVLLTKVEPKYPKAVLEKKHSQRTVWVEAVITTDGSIVCAKVLKSDDPELNNIVLEAIVQYKYKPGLKNGIPVPIRFTNMVRLTVR